MTVQTSDVSKQHQSTRTKKYVHILHIHLGNRYVIILRIYG